MIIAPFLCDLRIDEDGGMKIQMMSFPCRGIPRPGEEGKKHKKIPPASVISKTCPTNPILTG